MNFKNIRCFLFQTILILMCWSTNAQTDSLKFIKYLQSIGNWKLVSETDEKQFLSFSKDIPTSTITPNNNGYYFHGRSVRKNYNNVYAEFNYTTPDGLCGGGLIVQYSQKGEVIEYDFITEHCDSDEIEEGLFYTSEYRFFNDTIIEIEYIPHSSVPNSPLPESHFSYIFLKHSKMKIVASEFEISNDVEEYDEWDFDVCTILQRKEQLEKYSTHTLRIMRNTIFAIHGYSFSSKDLQAYFAKDEWYVPRGKTQEEILNELNEIELFNLKLIKEVENNR